MRLIDADALIEVIKKYKFGAISNESEREYTREIMLCFVNGSSTVYDISKVVAEMEKEREITRLNTMGYPKTIWEEAIDIMKRGWVE